MLTLLAVTRAGTAGAWWSATIWLALTEFGGAGSAGAVASVLAGAGAALLWFVIPPRPRWLPRRPTSMLVLGGVMLTIAVPAVALALTLSGPAG